MSWVALATAIMAVFAAITTLYLGKYSSRAILNQGQETNQWAYYQSKSIKAYIYEIQKQKLELEMLQPAGKPKAVMDKYSKLINDYDKQIKRYDVEKSEIKAQAEATTKSKEDAQARAGNFGYGLIFLQIAIMLSSISALTKKKPLFYFWVATVIGWIFFFLDAIYLFYYTSRILVMKEIDPESLAELNGQNGKLAYIAYRGKVFNVSDSKLWAGGLHMKRHHAAQDLSAEFEGAPHGEEVFERYPQVAILKQKIEQIRPMPLFLSSLIDRYPSLQRHPHPMMVHFPIVFMLSAPFFNFLYLITNMGTFESTALYCLIGGLLFLPVTMLTGWFTWWLNYLAKPMKPVALKILFSGILLVAASCALIWRITHPGVLDSHGVARIIYFLLTLSFAPLVSITGWLGASLTFPITKK